MPILSFEIEVNVARKGCEPVWRSLTDEYEDTLVWDTEEEVREALADEGRAQRPAAGRLGGILARGCAASCVAVPWRI